MRISDWSSDVCSSDLDGRSSIEHSQGHSSVSSAPRPNISMLKRDGRKQHRTFWKAYLARSNAENSSAIPAACPSQTTNPCPAPRRGYASRRRSEEHTSELQSLMRTSYAVFSLKKTTTT